MVPASFQIPLGIESVNGSSSNDTACGSQSCLLDGRTPDINTHNTSWASRLVTVRKNRANDDIFYEHVVFTFNFNYETRLRLVEIELFFCPEWEIGAPLISLYGDNDRNFTLASDFISIFDTRHCNSSCDSLTLISLVPENREPEYSKWHIVIAGFDTTPYTHWVHLAEVRFNDTRPENYSPPLCIKSTPMPPQGQLTLAQCRSGLCWT